MLGCAIGFFCRMNAFFMEDEWIRDLFVWKRDNVYQDGVRSF